MVCLYYSNADDMHHKQLLCELYDWAYWLIECCTYVFRYQEVYSSFGRKPIAMNTCCVGTNAVGRLDPHYVSDFECNLPGQKHVSSNFTSLAALNTFSDVINTVKHSIMHI